MANQCFWWRVVCFSLLRTHATTLTINYTNDVKRLPRFWKNTGLAPPDPLDKAGNFFESKEFNLNLEIIGSLPNNGIKNIRIHWLLNLLSIR
jgi:L-iduronidase